MTDISVIRPLRWSFWWRIYPSYGTQRVKIRVIQATSESPPCPTKLHVPNSWESGGCSKTKITHAYHSILHIGTNKYHHNFVKGRNCWSSRQQCVHRKSHVSQKHIHPQMTSAPISTNTWLRSSRFWCEMPILMKSRSSQIFICVIKCAWKNPKIHALLSLFSGRFQDAGDTVHAMTSIFG